MRAWMVCGGKAARLAGMMTAGERVPDSFCLTTEAFTGALSG